jgi:hypothetical protein
MFRALAPVAVALGAVDSLAGASTQLVASVNQPAKATVGASFAEGVIIQGLGVSYAQSWALSNTLPPGIVAQGATLQGGRLVVNPSSGTLLLTGTPSTAGTYNISISGYQYTNLTGPVTTATGQIVVAPAPNSAPAITRQPANVTTVAGGNATFSVTFTGTPAPTIQWSKDGQAIAGATGATLNLSIVASTNAGSYTAVLTNSLGSVTSAAAILTVNAAPAAPQFMSSPAPETVTAGDSATLTVAVTGVPTPALQWMKDSVALDGATDATLTLPQAQLADAGAYTVVATNSVGTATSAAAELVVAPAAAAPVFSAPPVSQTVAAGDTVVFTAPVIAAPAATFLWQHDGAVVAGATGSTLMLTGVTATSSGNYVGIATNSLGTATSSAAALTVSTGADRGRLTNLSILTDITADAPSFTLGTFVGGAGTVGTKPLLIRAAGPALAAFAVPNLLSDPKLDVFSGQSIVATNDNWSGAPAIQNAIAQVSAFGFPDPNSKDAAVFSPNLAIGGYTIQVSGVGGATGSVIAELYDATPAAAFSTSTPRLVNVSVLKQISAGGSLTAGFVIGGSTAKTVLIRVIGPALGLAPFNLGGAMADPQLTLYDSGSNAIAANNDWGGDPALTAAATRAGAFTVSDPASKDAMLLITLAPGSYTVTGRGAGGTGGTAIVEVYEVP